MGSLTPEQRRALRTIISDIDEDVQPKTSDADILRPLIADPIRHNVFDRD